MLHEVQVSGLVLIGGREMTHMGMERYSRFEDVHSSPEEAESDIVTHDNCMPVVGLSLEQIPVVHRGVHV